MFITSEVEDNLYIFLINHYCDTHSVSSDLVNIVKKNNLKEVQMNFHFKLTLVIINLHSKSVVTKKKHTINLRDHRVCELKVTIDLISTI